MHRHRASANPATARRTRRRSASTACTYRARICAPHAHQREYLKQIIAHDVTFGIGPAGTGKTYLAVACAVDALHATR